MPPRWGKLNDGRERRREARPAVEAIQASNQEARELAPKLLSELGDLGSAVGVQKLEGMSRYLERFELTVQRIQQDLNGLEFRRERCRRRRRSVWRTAWNS